MIGDNHDNHDNTALNIGIHHNKQKRLQNMLCDLKFQY